MQTAEKLSITLPGEMLRAIRAKVESGSYASNSEAMRAWMERDRRFATLEAAFDRGIADVEAGGGKTTAKVRRTLLEGMGVKDDPAA